MVDRGRKLFRSTMGNPNALRKTLLPRANVFRRSSKFKIWERCDVAYIFDMLAIVRESPIIGEKAIVIDLFIHL